MLEFIIGVITGAAALAVVFKGLSYRWRLESESRLWISELGRGQWIRHGEALWLKFSKELHRQEKLGRISPDWAHSIGVASHALITSYFAEVAAKAPVEDSRQAEKLTLLSPERETEADSGTETPGVIDSDGQPPVQPKPIAEILEDVYGN